MSERRRLGGRARMDLLGHAVLLVEDDFCQARDIQQALQHAGAKVIGPFADPKSALRSIGERELSCAIVDISLNNGVRFDNAAAFLEMGIPIMLLSGPESEDVPEALAGVPVMRKPVDYRSLLSLAAQMANKRRAATALPRPR